MTTPSTQDPDRWRSWSLAAREREYSPSSCVDDIEPFIQAYIERSAQARADVAAAGRAVIEVHYGTEPSQTIDLVTPAARTGPTPLVVFIHGGYWRQLSKRESFAGANECIDHGVAYAAVDYTLAPTASLDEIVTECRNAVRRLRQVASEHNIDADRIVVCGSSAGAHLTAMVAVDEQDDWRPAAVGLLSGVFDLEPLIGTYIDEPLSLDLVSARRNSPLFAPLQDFPRSIVAYGSNETSEFKRQSHAMADRLAEAGSPVEIFEVDGRNHFDIVFDLCDPTTQLGWSVIQAARLANTPFGSS